MSLPSNNTYPLEKLKKIFSLSFFAALLILPTESGLNAQEKTSTNKKEPFLLEQVHALGLDSLKKGRTTVHFSSGYRKQAIKLGTRTEKALQFFQDSLEVGLKEFHLILADRKDWEKLAEFPYGKPPWGLGGWQARNLGKLVSGRPPSTIISADAKGVVYNQLHEMEECLTNDLRQRLEETGLSWEEAARHYVETITFHEIGHSITELYEINFPTRWFSELLPNFFAYAYLYNHEPLHAKVWNLMPKVTFACYTPKVRTLEDFMLGKVTAQDYHWYQSMFIQRANRIVQNSGMDFIHEAQRLFSGDSQGKTLTEKTEAVYNNMDSMSEEEATRRLKKINTELISRLEETAPGFKAWAEGFSDNRKSR